MKTEIEIGRRERELNNIMNLDKENLLNYIRGVLTINGKRERFNMSGYDADRDVGSCTLHNQRLLNLFAHLGLYDFTTYLVLDFYKGNPTLYYSYWEDLDEYPREQGFSGYTTSEIIYEVLQLTIFSGKNRRR